MTIVYVTVGCGLCQKTNKWWGAQQFLYGVGCNVMLSVDSDYVKFTMTTGYKYKKSIFTAFFIKGGGQQCRFLKPIGI